MTRASSRSLLAGASALVLLLTSCGTGGPGEPDQPSGDEETPLAEREEFAEYYGQELSWEACEGSQACASVTVPMDYSDPDGEQIEIEIISSETAQDDDAGYLLTNPGGPGSSGYDTVAEQLNHTFTDAVTDEYDVVGFDPRGVNRSAPVQCLDDEEMDDYREQVQEEDLDDEQAQEQAREQASELAEGCEEGTGEVLRHVDTVSAARDMDIIRAALDEEELNYLGFSYGTKLGMTYAEHYPETVGRFVLDGMMDTSVDSHELELAQARGFEDALEGYAEWCVEQEDCPVDGEPEDVVAAVQDLFEQIEEQPWESPDGRTVSISVFVNGFILPMYDPQGWEFLNEGLSAALEQDDFFHFQYWADQSAGRDQDGTYDWMSQLAFGAIMCLDYPVSSEPEEIEEEVEALTEAAPTFGPYLGHSGLTCDEWPHEPVGETWEPEQAQEAGEMLMIGTTGDPATPVEWAENMHELVPGSSLLISEGEGHLAYRPGADCVTDIVEAYLFEGELFGGREECAAA